MVDNIDIELYAQKSEITTSEPDITIEITGLVQLNSFIGLDDTPTYYENGKFFKVIDNKIVYTDIELKDLKGKIEDNPELQAEITKQVGESTDKLVQTAISKAINLHDSDINAHQSIQNTVAQNFETLNNKIDLNQIDTETKFTEVDKKIGDNKNYITRVDEYSKEVNKKLEDLTLEVDVDIKGDINQLREDLTNTNEVIQNNYATLDKKIDDTKSDLTESITQLTTVVNDNYTTLDSKIDGVQNNLDTTNQTVADNYTALDTKINTTKAELAKDVSDKYSTLDTRVSANTKDITDLTQTVQNDYKEVNGHITDLYNKKVDKVEGKSLIEDTEIERLKTLKNYDDTQIKADIADINSTLETKASTTDLENRLKTKQDKLTFDITPTANSNNPVTSDGIKTELDKKVDSTTLTTELAKKQNKLTAGTGIKIEGDIISNTQTSAEWGNIQGNITAQKDLQNALNTKADTTTVNTELDKKVDKVEGKSLLLDTEITRLAGLKNYDDTAIKKSVSDLSTTVTDNYTTLDGKITDIGTEVTDLSGRMTANEADIMLKADKTALDTKQDKLVSGTNIKTINNESLLGEGNIEVKSNNGGIELCTILCMPFGIDESENKYRYLNGQTIVQSQYPAFTAKVKSWQSTRASLFTTETEWQSIKTASKLGQCGKFVIDDEAGTIRLPAIININGLTDLSNAGLIKDESLPNITGSVRAIDAPASIGAFTGVNDVNVGRYGGNVRDTGVVTFDASRSSSTYKNNAPVQQEAVQYPYVICVNTGVEEAERPINNYQVNNVYSYGMSQYYKGTINNLSWLRSEGQWNKSTIYTGLYNWALAQLNASVDGFKLSTTDNITDYDWVINTTDETFRLPLLNGNENLIGSQVINYTIPTVNGQTYPATHNGQVQVNATNSVANQYIRITNVTTGAISESRAPIMGAANVVSVWVNRGDTFKITADVISTIDSVELFKAVGNGSLYYYVGDTLQNTDLINIARMQEELVNVNSPARGYLVETYVNGTSGYNLYSNGYCEQWGVSNPNANVTLLKEYLNSEYNILLTPLRSDANNQITAWVVPPISNKSFVIAASPTYTASVYWRTSGYTA